MLKRASDGIIKRESLHIRIPGDTLEQIDNVRGNITRSIYIQRILERHLRFKVGGKK